MLYSINNSYWKRVRYLTRASIIHRLIVTFNQFYFLKLLLVYILYLVSVYVLRRKKVINNSMVDL
jgi:hypothetical protein